MSLYVYLIYVTCDFGPNTKLTLREKTRYKVVIVLPIKRENLSKTPIFRWKRYLVCKSRVSNRVEHFDVGS